MEIGLGVLGWSPQTLGQATMAELMAGYDGWREAHGLNSAAALSQGDIDHLRELIGKNHDH